MIRRPSADGALIYDNRQDRAKVIIPEARYSSWKAQGPEK